MSSRVVSASARVVRSVIILLVRSCEPLRFFELLQAAGIRFDALEMADELAPRARLLERNAAGVYAGLADRMADHREAGDADIVGDGDVAGHGDSAPNDTPFADGRAARDAGTACDHRMFSDADGM